MSTRRDRGPSEAAVMAAIVEAVADEEEAVTGESLAGKALSSGTGMEVQEMAVAASFRNSEFGKPRL